MSEIQQTSSFICPICDTPVPAGSTICPNVNCKEDLSSLVHWETVSNSSYEKALKLITEKKLSNALDLLHNAVNINPEFVDAWVVLGKIYAQEKDNASAERCWNKALMILPNESRATAGLRRLKQIRQRNIFILWVSCGLLTLLIVWLGIRSLIEPSKDVAKAFADNPSLAAYNLRVEQKQNVVLLIGSLPGETEKKLIIAAAQIAMPEATIESSQLILAPVSTSTAAQPFLTPTTMGLSSTPSSTSMQTPTSTPTRNPTPHVCRVSTGIDGGLLNLRATGNPKSEIVGLIKEGEILFIIGSANNQNWISVKTADGLDGWIYSRFCQ